MKVFGIAGHSGMGKTTLLERLVPHIASRGLVVSLIKHSHKTVDIDRPGKVSYSLRVAGGNEGVEHRRADAQFGEIHQVPLRLGSCIDANRKPQCQNRRKEDLSRRPRGRGRWIVAAATIRAGSP